MSKKTHSLRFEDRTWGQLEELQDWLQVGNRTKVIEVLAEREHTKMSEDNLSRMITILTESGYKAGEVTENTFIVYTGDEGESFAIEKPDSQTVHPEQVPGSTYCTAIHGITLAALNKSLPRT